MRSVALLDDSTGLLWGQGLIDTCKRKGEN